MSRLCARGGRTLRTFSGLMCGGGGMVGNLALGDRKFGSLKKARLRWNRGKSWLDVENGQSR